MKMLHLWVISFNSLYNKEVLASYNRVKLADHNARSILKHVYKIDRIIQKETLMLSCWDGV